VIIIALMAMGEDSRRAATVDGTHADSMTVFCRLPLNLPKETIDPSSLGGRKKHQNKFFSPGVLR
jgi:hypothetical protein